MSEPTKLKDCPFPYTFNRHGQSGAHAVGKRVAFGEPGGRLGQDPILDLVKAVLPGVIWRLHLIDDESFAILVERELTGAELGAITAIVNSIQDAG